MDVINRVLTFWFRDNFEERRKVWFIKNADFDSEIKIKFGDEVKKASTGVYDYLVQTPEGALDLRILLDQSHVIYLGVILKHLQQILRH